MFNIGTHQLYQELHSDIYGQVLSYPFLGECVLDIIYFSTLRRELSILL